MAATGDTNRTLSPLRQATTVVRTDVRRLLREYRTIGLAIIQLLPVVASILLVHVWSLDGLSVYSSLIQYVEFPLIMPLIAIFYGGPVLVNEMEGRTLTFLTLRPIPKPILYLGKWTAGAILSVLLTLLPMLMIFVSCLVATGSLQGSGVDVGRTLLAATGGVLAYSAIFAALGALFATNLIAGIVYFVVVEMIMGAIPTLKLVTVGFHVRIIAGFEADQSSGLLAGLLPVGNITPGGWVSGGVVVAMIALASLAGALIFKHRQYHV